LEPKSYYPINVDISGKKCVVIGGGPVGERKVFSLLECGALVTLVALTLTRALEELVSAARIKLERRSFLDSDIQGAFIVYCATNDGELNEKVFRLAQGRSMLVNVADNPQICNFIVPAIVRRGPLVASVSTSAAAPALAKKLKKILEGAFNENYAPALLFLQRKREIIKNKIIDIKNRASFFSELADSGIMPAILNAGSNVSDIAKALDAAESRFDDLMKKYIEIQSLEKAGSVNEEK